MSNTYARYPADGSTAIFTVPCPYIERAHIKVRVNAFLCTLGAHYDFINPTQIQFRPQFVPTSNAIVEVRRETISNVALVTFQDGAILNESDLNTATLQTLFISQETRDYYEAAFVEGFKRITGGSFVSPQDAIDAAVQEVLGSSLLADLQARISDIDANGEAIIGNSLAISTMQSVIDSLLEIDGVGIATFVLNEQEQRISGDEALASSIALIGAVNGDSTAFVLDMSKVRVDASTSLGSRLSGIDTAVGDNAAAIATEATARSSGDSAIASTVSSLSSTVGGHTAALATYATVIDGIAAQYMVKTDVNGHVAGFGLYNEGAESEFIILANKFAVVDPSDSGNVKVPFVVSGGVVHMQDVVIGTAVIENAAITTLKVGADAVSKSANTSKTGGILTSPSTASSPDTYVNFQNLSMSMEDVTLDLDLGSEAGTKWVTVEAMLQPTHSLNNTSHSTSTPYISYQVEFDGSVVGPTFGPFVLDKPRTSSAVARTSTPITFSFSTTLTGTKTFKIRSLWQIRNSSDTAVSSMSPSTDGWLSFGPVYLSASVRKR